jgi:hypothetical protein
MKPGPAMTPSASPPMVAAGGAQTGFNSILDSLWGNDP